MHRRGEDEEITKNAITEARQSDIMKKACETIGLDPSEYGNLSKRAGRVTELAEAGVHVMAQCRSE